MMDLGWKPLVVKKYASGNISEKSAYPCSGFLNTINFDLDIYSVRLVFLVVQP